MPPSETMQITKEVRDYASWLGIDLDRYPDLASLAYEGLYAPLPSPWKSTTTPQGDLYFYNAETKVTVWEHPEDATYRARAKAEMSLRASPPRVVQNRRLSGLKKLKEKPSPVLRIAGEITLPSAVNHHQTTEPTRAEDNALTLRRMVLLVDPMEEEEIHDCDTDNVISPLSRSPERPVVAPGALPIEEPGGDISPDISTIQRVMQSPPPIKYEFVLERAAMIQECSIEVLVSCEHEQRKLIEELEVLAMDGHKKFLTQCYHEARISQTFTRNVRELRTVLCDAVHEAVRENILPPTPVLLPPTPCTTVTSKHCPALTVDAACATSLVLYAEAQPPPGMKPCTAAPDTTGHGYDARKRALRIAKLEWKKEVLTAKANGLRTRDHNRLHEVKAEIDCMSSALKLEKRMRNRIIGTTERREVPSSAPSLWPPSHPRAVHRDNHDLVNLLHSIDEKLDSLTRNLVGL